MHIPIQAHSQYYLFGVKVRRYLPCVYVYDNVCFVYKYTQLHKCTNKGGGGGG